MLNSIRSRRRFLEEKRQWKSEHYRLQGSIHCRLDDCSQRTSDDRLSDTPSPADRPTPGLFSIETLVLYKTAVTPLVFSFGMVREDVDGIVSTRRMVKRECKHLGTDLTLISVVRRPGCAGCRINAQIIVDVAKQDKVALVGVVKETGDYSALHEFREDYFGQFPIYKDDKCHIFDCLGNRKVPAWSLFRKSSKLRKEGKLRKVRHVSFGGDGRTLGGILVFDRHGNLRHTIHEAFGKVLCVEEIRDVIAKVRLESR